MLCMVTLTRKLANLLRGVANSRSTHFYVTVCSPSFLCFLVHSDFFGTLPEVDSFFSNEDVSK